MINRYLLASFLAPAILWLGCATAPPPPYSPDGRAGRPSRPARTAPTVPAPERAEPKTAEPSEPAKPGATSESPAGVQTAPVPTPPTPGPSVTSTAPWRYALMIDASSSASTLQIFRWRDQDGGRLPQIEAAPGRHSDETWEKRVKPGLASYAGQPEKAAASLQPLLEFALDKLGQLPAEPANATVYLRATAGMRLLPEEEQAAILESVRSYLDSLPFGESTAEVITGADEGVYGWLTANYVLGHLDHGGPFPTVGALDLGGASAQITFQPLDFPREHVREVTLGRNTYHLYTRSYLGLGQDVAREKVDSPDCFLEGYPLTGGRKGRGDFDACRAAIRAELSVPCSEDESPCPLLTGHQPPVYGDFLALSVYAYAADYFSLDERLIPSEVAASGRSFCATDWLAWVDRDPEIAGDPYAPTYCYAAAHIETLLTDGFGFRSDTERITAPLRVQGIPIGWTLGALVYELAGR